MPKILIVEDEQMIAGLLKEILVEDGYEVCGVTGTVTEAVALVRHHKPNLAVIDLRLAENGLGTEIPAQLGELGGLGILYTTGASRALLTAADGHARIAKPYRDTDLLRGLQIVAELISTGATTPPFPPGFQLLPSAN